MDDSKAPAEKSKKDVAKRAGGARAKVGTWLRKGHDPLAGLYLTIPVFLLYHLGILLIDRRNGVDLVSVATFKLLKFSTLAYVLVTLGVAVAIAIAIWLLRRRGKMKPAEWGSMLIESAILAVVTPVIASWFVKTFFSWSVASLAMGGDVGVVDKLVMSAGAGFHEEIVFRVGLFGGMVWLLKVCKLSTGKAAFIAAVLSSIVFSAVHYVGPFGDDLVLASFMFRTFSGLILAAIYWWRGFAVAVYTHMFYDMFYFFVLA